MNARKPTIIKNIFTDEADEFASIRQFTAEARSQLDELEANKLKFPDWLPIVSPTFTWNWRHQEYLYQRLERVTIGELKRLIIAMPPRHTKSETVTVRYAAYRLEQNPSLRIIIGAYNQKLANKFSRKIRRILTGRIDFSSDCKAVEEWETTAGGGIRAVGVGGGVTGFGADLIIIDDPVKSRKQAESETYRENTWDWFNDDLYTRLEPGGEIIVIQTRWHDDDLSGRLQKQSLEEDGEHWEVVSLPALAEENDPLGRKPGEALCPERYDRAALLRIKSKLTGYGFDSLYQQRPTPREGALFKLGWFEKKIIDRAPDNLRWVRGYDLAASQKTSADYFASFSCAFDKSGNLYIRDGFRKRLEYPEQKKQAKKWMKEEKRTRHAITKPLHGIALVQDLRRDAEVRGVGFRAVAEVGDKYSRACAWADLAADGKVYLVRGSWIGDFLAECIRFTGNGDTHDDQVDAVSIAVQLLSNRSGKLEAF